MAHQKNNSVRILSSSAKKKAKPVYIYVLLGILGSILTLCCIIFLYFFFGKTTDSTQHYPISLTQNSIEQNKADNPLNTVDDSQISDEKVSENQIDEKQLRSLFKPTPPAAPSEKHSAANNPSSPFDPMLGQTAAAKSSKTVRNSETKPTLEYVKKEEKATVKDAQPIRVKPSSLDSLNIENELKSVQKSATRTATTKAD